MPNREIENRINEKNKEQGLEERAPTLVLIIGIFLTCITIWASYQNARDRDTLRFELATESVEGKIRERLDSYVSSAWAAVGLLEANDLKLDQDQFQRFYQVGERVGTNDGVAGLSFVRKIKPEERDSFLSATKAKLSDFALFPATDDEEAVFAVTLIHPEAKVQSSVLGLNPFAEPKRRRALMQAAETGKAALTEKIDLLNDEDHQQKIPAILIYVPVFSADSEADSQARPAEDIADNLYGFVGAGFRLENLLKHLHEGALANEIDFRIYSQEKQPQNLMMETRNPHAKKGRYQTTKTLQVAGQTWVIDYWSLPGFQQRSALFQVPIVAVVGLLLSFCLYSLAIVQTRARKDRELALSLQIQRAQDLEAQDKIKTQFFSNLNHELRTPLNGILGMSDLLYDTDLDEVQKDYLNSIGSCGKALHDLVSDVLDLSKINAGKMTVRNVPVRLREIFEQALQVVRGLALGKGLQLSLEWDANLPEKVKLDEPKLRQVLVNLLGNAVKFTAEGSVILGARMEATEPGHERVRFQVRDTGIGIAQEDLRHLFQPFSQVDNDSAPSEQKGTGLGLHICREMLQLMGGDIEVSSVLGKGTTFSCYLPLERVDKEEEESLQLQTITPLPTRKLKVLIADDNPINRRVLSLQLEKLGHETMIVPGGQEAVEAVKENEFDLILMDCQMPVVDGLEATRRIKAESSYTPPIVALTAYAEESQREACAQAGMSDFLTKPVDVTKLGNLLNKYAILLEKAD